MKILPLILNIRLNSTQTLPQNRNDSVQYSTAPLLRSPGNDTFERGITFTSADRPEDVSPSRSSLEKLYKHHLTCLCCGREMIEPEEIRKLANTGALRCNSKEAVQILEKYEGNMHSVEKEVFGILKEKAKNTLTLIFNKYLH